METGSPPTPHQQVVRFEEAAAVADGVSEGDGITSTNSTDWLQELSRDHLYYLSKFRSGVRQCIKGNAGALLRRTDCGSWTCAGVKSGAES